MNSLWISLTTRALAEYPDFRIAYKAEVWWMRVLAVLLFFNKTFATDYVTTIGSTVYYPSQAFVQADPDRAARILAHELVHIADEKRLGKLVYRAMYLLPQALALLAPLALLAFWHTDFLAFLLFLVALVPWPSPGRTWIERRGSTMDLAVVYWLTAGTRPSLAEDLPSMRARFNGPNYFWMSWITANTDAWFSNIVVMLRSGGLNAFAALPENRPFAIVRDALASVGQDRTLTPRVEG